MRLFLALALAALGSFATAADKLQAELEANYRAFNAAIKKNDIAALSKFLSPDCTAQDRGGPVVQRAKIVADFQKQMTAMKNVTWDRKLSHLVRKGSTATVTVDGHITSTVAGQDGKPHQMEVNATSQDTWTKAKTGWLLKKIQIQKRTIKVDGQLMPDK